MTDSLYREMTELNAWKSNTFIQGIECPICGFSMYGTEIHTMDDWHFCPKCGKRLYGNLPEFEEPTYEEVPIDLDDDYYCDMCTCPEVHNCFDNVECYENLPEGECCMDNLEKQVGEICFKYDVAEKYAKVIVEVLRKERKKNESMYICR